MKQPDEIIKSEIEAKYPSRVSTVREIRQYNNVGVQLPSSLPSIADFERAKHSMKSNGLIRAYAACTHQGPVRDYNEDRVAIILNIAKP